jgi:predicted restriction endonuclease
MDKAPFTVEQYRRAFAELTISEKQAELLLAHYLAPNRAASAKALAHSVGWSAYQPVNSQYGNLAKKLINKIGSEDYVEQFHMHALSKIWFSSESYWQMWPEVADALELVGLAEPQWLEIEAGPNGPTDREAIIKQRVAQGKFRLSLLQFWHGTCSVTGAGDASMLIASHIKPWRICADGERVDPFNGFLLAPNLDRAFDNGYISFADDGRVLIQSGREESLRDFGINADIRLRKLDDRNRRYLAEHRRLHGYED